jgi:hypothetical protein
MFTSRTSRATVQRQSGRGRVKNIDWDGHPQNGQICPIDHPVYPAMELAYFARRLRLRIRGRGRRLATVADLGGHRDRGIDRRTVGQRSGAYPADGEPGQVPERQRVGSDGIGGQPATSYSSTVRLDSSGTISPISTPVKCWLVRCAARASREA